MPTTTFLPKKKGKPQSKVCELPEMDPPSELNAKLPELRRVLALEIWKLTCAWFPELAPISSPDKEVVDAGQ